MKDFQLLQKLAQQHGIQASYFDVSGEKRNALPETLSAILTALGVPANNESEVVASLSAMDEGRKGIEPVIIAWAGKQTRIPLRMESNVLRRNVYCHLHLETGEAQNWAIRLDQLSVTRVAKNESESLISTQITLPKLPLGYHQFQLETIDGISSSLIICAPPKSYSSPELSRHWGAFLPMYAAHSGQSWGAGNFSDWEKMTEWIASLGGGVVGCLPILAAFLDPKKCEPSPYSPASRLFWNEFFVDVTRVPELSDCDAAAKIIGTKSFQGRLTKFRDAANVDYVQEMKARREVLEVLANFFFSKHSARRKQFEKYSRERPQLRDYAMFRAAGEKMKTGWPEWPRRMRGGKLQAGDFSESVARYHQYVQWLAQEQMDALLKSCSAKDVRFYLDLPLGVNSDGYDVWRERDVFAKNISAGAPPDVFFTRGQNWGFAPLHPQKMREQGYKYFLEMLRFQMRHTGLLRIDHVMCLRRLYWIPRGAAASEGAYVIYPEDELYAILCLESHRHKCVIAGENLGIVPPEVNDAMLRHQFRQMYVLQYELCPNPKKALREAPRRSVASLNTHDMPAFAAFFKGEDIRDRMQLGLIKKQDLKAELAARKKLTYALIKFLKKHSKRDVKNESRSAMQASLNFLAASDAEILLVNLEDLWLETRPQNVPGTSHERANWQRKAKFSIEQLQKMKELQETLEQLTNLRKRR